MNQVVLLALLNLAFACGGMWACGCRLNVSTPWNVRAVVRAQYVAVFVGCFVSGFSPLLFRAWPGGGWPGIGQVTFTALVFFWLTSEMKRWRGGPPDDVRPPQPPPPGVERRRARPGRRFEDSGRDSL